MILFLAMIDDETEQELFIRIYEQFFRLMLFVANDMLKDYALAEDVVQEAFLAIAKNMGKISKNSGILSSKTKNFCVTIVRNKCIDLLRKQKGESVSFEEMEYEMESDLTLPVEAMIQEEGFQMLKDCIRSLDEDYRIVFELRYFQEYSQKEIAEILDISVKLVNMRLYRAKKQLQERLGEGGRL